MLGKLTQFNISKNLQQCNNYNRVLKGTPYFNNKHLEAGLNAQRKDPFEAFGITRVLFI